MSQVRKFLDFCRTVVIKAHRRKVAAMGGMSAQIPIKGDDKANEIAMSKVRADKLREVTAGHDGPFQPTFPRTEID